MPRNNIPTGYTLSFDGILLFWYHIARFKAYDAWLRERRAMFLRQTGTRKAAHLTLVTAIGIAETKYKGVFQSVITLDDLLRE